MSLTLNVNAGLSSYRLAIANTLPPTFQTCEPPHCTTCEVAGRVRQNRLYSVSVMVHVAARRCALTGYWLTADPQDQCLQRRRGRLRARSAAHNLAAGYAGRLRW